MPNALIDRHHAGLFNSLQLLFEDRLGYAVYTPIGQAWWDRGYWQFGKGYGDDRLAQQFLNVAEFQPIDTSLTPRFTYSETRDPEFPDRPIRGIVEGQAARVDFDIVLATVSDNQQGFHRWAQEHGAKYALHVGNTNQYIDWALDPLVLNCSEMPMLGRHVNIGEEFDSDGLFAYSRPTVPKAIASFVNCMPQIACYPLFQDAQRLMPDFGFFVGGINAENIKPIKRLAGIMRSSGWGWHDKEHGDGYGHIIHYWAAIGRPLIGHASHYNGKNASVLWRDLVTCIDLDKHPLEEAVELIRSISSDQPRHEAMCRAIREVFDATTDWADDAEKVRNLLEVT